MAINTILSQLNNMKQHYSQKLGEKNLLLRQQQALSDELSTLRREIKSLDAEQVVLSHVSRTMMADMTSRIEEPVSMALQLLWGDARRFRFRFGEHRGEPAAWREVLKREGGDDSPWEVFDPDSQSGGGVSDVVSLVLDLSVMQMVDNVPQGLISRDEPGKFVDKENGAEKARNIAFFLKEYVARTGIQFMFITHIEQLAEVADVAYRVEKIKEMTSKVVRVK